MSEDEGFQHRSDRSEGADRGYALIGLLIVVVILGVLVTIVLSSSHGSTRPGGATKNSADTTTTTPQSIASGARQSAVAACEVEFRTIETALGTYRALNGVLPLPGTAWAASHAHGGPFMQSWPSGAPDFSITWNGSTLSVVPAKGTSSHGSYGTSVPATGCFAL